MLPTAVALAPVLAAERAPQVLEGDVLRRPAVFDALERAPSVQHVAAPQPDARLRLELVHVAHAARIGPRRERRFHFLSRLKSAPAVVEGGHGRVFFAVFFASLLWS
jgi:hypothetical protein